MVGRDQEKEAYDDARQVESHAGCAAGGGGRLCHGAELVSPGKHSPDKHAGQAHHDAETGILHPLLLCRGRPDDEGLAALQTSKIEAYASDRIILVGLVLQARGTSRYALISDDLSYEPYGFMVRRDDSAFRFLANRVLARIYRSGAIGAIYSKWFGALGKPTPALVLMTATRSPGRIWSLTKSFRKLRT